MKNNNLFPPSQHFNFNLIWSSTLIIIIFLFSLYPTLSHHHPKSPGHPKRACSEKEAYHSLNIILNPNGSLTRLNPNPLTPPAPDPSLPLPVLSKDIPINPSKHTWARIFIPHNALHPNKDLPLVLFFHGGGFLFLHASSAMFHTFSSNMARHLHVIVASVEYRLAPEHRLPAAYDDAVEALHWIKTAQDDWLTQHVDYSKCYLMGSSAGGNIAYFAGLRAADDVADLEPLKIRGLILVQPFFGGVQRTGSEVRRVDDKRLSMCVGDLLWKLSLPVGVDRDYEYCNPTVGDGPRRVERIGRLGWRVLVTGTGGDPLVDRQKILVKMMRERKVRVVGHFTKGGYHGIQDRDLHKAKELYEVVKEFISL